MEISQSIVRSSAATLMGGPPAEGSEEADTTSAEAERFLNAARSAIDQAISSNSLDFLMASRQQGGE